MCQKVEIYVPSRKGNGNPIPAQLRDEWMEHAFLAMCRMYGGATAIHNCEGLWINESTGAMARETISIVYSYYNGCALGPQTEEIISLAKRLKGGLVQNAIAYAIDGKINFV